MAGGIATANNSTDFIEVTGVRGRVDLSHASTPGADIFFEVNGTSSLFTGISGRVATSAGGLVVSSSAGCTGTPRIKEVFGGAFVQHVLSAAGTPIPVGARVPPAGATNNTQINIVFGGGVNWPAIVAGANAFGSPGAAGRLERTVETATQVVYEFATTNQGTSDVNTERFDIFLN